MRLEPKVTAAITRFLDSSVKLRATEWEPRYNLTPVTVSDILTVPHPQTPAAKPETKKAVAKGADKAKAKANNDAGGNNVVPKEQPKRDE